MQTKEWGREKNRMYMNGILNSGINQVVGNLGHTDCICIGDCGLPVPDGVVKIDLAVRLGSPTVEEILLELKEHICVEKIVLARELEEQNPETVEKLQAFFPKAESEMVSHADFKKRVGKCRAMIRTGDVHAYTNIILQSGCIF